MKKNKRLKLTFYQLLTHYGIVLFLLFIAALAGWDLVEIYVTDTYSGVRTADEIIISLPFILVFVLIFSVIQYKRLNFKEFQILYTEEQFQEAIKRTVKDLEWNIQKNNKAFFRAIRPWNWTGSWGEMITIKKGKNQLFINSICDPDHMSSIASYGWNQKNIKTFIKNLLDVLNNRPHEIEIEQEINEWSAKSFLIRLLAYPICIIFIVLGIYIVLENLSIKSFFLGIIVIIIASTYLFSDIKILITKNNK
jgi:hypothetical protein